LFDLYCFNGLAPYLALLQVDSSQDHFHFLGTKTKLKKTFDSQVFWYLFLTVKSNYFSRNDKSLKCVDKFKF